MHKCFECMERKEKERSGSGLGHSPFLIDSIQVRNEPPPSLPSPSIPPFRLEPKPNQDVCVLEWCMTGDTRSHQRRAEGEIHCILDEWSPWIKREAFKVAIYQLDQRSSMRGSSLSESRLLSPSTSKDVNVIVPAADEHTWWLKCVLQRINTQVSWDLYMCQFDRQTEREINTLNK